MKANRGQMERALDAPGQGAAADVRFFLLYGPDEAGSQALAKRLERAMGPQAERIDLDAPTLREDPARLPDEAASFSMFGDRRWIRLNGIGEESVPALTALLEAEAAGNPVIAVAGALKATSKLVKLAIDHKAALACISYQPDGREAEQIAIGIARDGGLRLSSDLARRIVDLSGGDRALMAGEIEKLILYLDAAPDGPVEATAEALDALSADNPETEVGPLVNAVLGGDLKAMHRELTAMAQAGTAMAAVIRWVSASCLRRSRIGWSSTSSEALFNSSSASSLALIARLESNPEAADRVVEPPWLLWESACADRGWEDGSRFGFMPGKIGLGSAKRQSIKEVKG